MTSEKPATETVASFGGKKFINNPSNVVTESLAGFLVLHPALRLLPPSTIFAPHSPQTIPRVAIISGGGSGHEPSHIGWVGRGMLDAAVCGGVFASPPSTQIYEAAKKVSLDRGVLMIVKNYTGDRLQFGLTAERYIRETIDPIDVIIVQDDCSIPNDRVGAAGRRGLAGTIFVHKIAGAAARSGLPIQEVTRRAYLASTSIGTVGASLSSCSVPGQAPTFSIGANEVELGLGIHGEPGFQRIPLLTAFETVKICLDMIMDDSPARSYVDIRPGCRVALMVNNLGGTSAIEIGILVNDSIKYLRQCGVESVRVYAGHFMTSLEMQGVSFTLLNIPFGTDGDIFLASLDEPVECDSWPRDSSVAIPPYRETEKKVQQSDVDVAMETPYTPISPTSLLFHKVLTSICHAVISSESSLNALDRFAGDGDCGTTLASAAKSVLGRLGDAEGGEVWECGLNLDVPSETLATIARVCEREMGGSSGALMSIFLNAASSHLQDCGSSTPEDPARNLRDWSTAVYAGTAAVTRYGCAAPGDRTLIDALQPFSDSLVHTVNRNVPLVDVVKGAVEAARLGRDRTKGMQRARLGRASYVGKNLEGSVDPGAEAVVVIVEAVLDAMQG